MFVLKSHRHGCICITGAGVHAARVDSFIPFFPIMSTLVAAYLLLQQSHALPVVLVQHSSDNDTASSGPAWVSSPNVRGTYDLILGCLVTSFLSAWIAWHPNFGAGHGPVSSILRRFMWIMAAMAAPEMMFFCAWEQRCAARRLQQEVNRLGQRAYDAEDVDSAVRSYEQHLHQKVRLNPPRSGNSF